MLLLLLFLASEHGAQLFCEIHKHIRSCNFTDAFHVEPNEVHKIVFADSVLQWIVKSVRVLGWDSLTSLIQIEQIVQEAHKSTIFLKKDGLRSWHQQIVHDVVFLILLSYLLKLFKQKFHVFLCLADLSVNFSFFLVFLF